MRKAVFNNAGEFIGWSNDPDVGVDVPDDVYEYGVKYYTYNNSVFTKLPNADAIKSTIEANTTAEVDAIAALRATILDEEETTENRFNALVNYLFRSD